MPRNVSDTSRLTIFCKVSKICHQDNPTVIEELLDVRIFSGLPTMANMSGL